jgi:hypothetical protein
VEQSEKIQKDNIDCMNLIRELQLSSSKLERSQ